MTNYHSIIILVLKNIIYDYLKIIYKSIFVFHSFSLIFFIINKVNFINSTNFLMIYYHYFYIHMVVIFYEYLYIILSFIMYHAIIIHYL